MSLQQEYYELCNIIQTEGCSVSGPEEISEWATCVEKFQEPPCKNCYDNAKCSPRVPVPTVRALPVITTTVKPIITRPLPTTERIPPTQAGIDRTATTLRKISTTQASIDDTTLTTLPKISTTIGNNQPNATQMTFIGNTENNNQPTKFIVAATSAGSGVLFSILIVTLIVITCRRRKRASENKNNNEMLTYSKKHDVGGSVTLPSQADSAYSTYIPYSEQGTLPSSATIPDALYAINPESGYAYYLPDGYPLKYTSLRKHNKQKFVNEPEYAVPIPKHGRNRVYDTPADDDPNDNGRRRVVPSQLSTDSYTYPDLNNPEHIPFKFPPYYYKIDSSIPEYEGTDVGAGRFDGHAMQNENHVKQPISRPILPGSRPMLLQSRPIPSGSHTMLPESSPMLPGGRPNPLGSQTMLPQVGSRPIHHHQMLPNSRVVLPSNHGMQSTGHDMPIVGSRDRVNGNPPKAQKDVEGTKALSEESIHMLGKSAEYRDFKKFESPSNAPQSSRMFGSSTEYQDPEKKFDNGKIINEPIQSNQMIGSFTDYLDPNVKLGPAKLQMLGDSFEYQDPEEEFGSNKIHMLGDSSDYQDIESMTPIQMLGNSSEYQDMEEEFGNQYLLPRQFLQPGGSILERDIVSALDKVNATDLDKVNTISLDKDTANFSDDDKFDYVDPAP